MKGSFRRAVYFGKKLISFWKCYYSIVLRALPTPSIHQMLENQKVYPHERRLSISGTWKHLFLSAYWTPRLILFFFRINDSNKSFIARGTSRAAWCAKSTSIRGTEDGGEETRGDGCVQNTQSYLMEYELLITIVMKLSENCRGILFLFSLTRCAYKLH